MKLQEKTLVVFVSLLILALLCMSVFFSTILLASYNALEEQYITKDLNQVVDELNGELFHLSALVSDWAPWDDTYNFVNGKDPEYLKSNLVAPAFENLHLNLIVITNARGELIFSGGYDLQNREMVPVPVFFSGPLDLNNPLMNMSDPRHITSGILMLPEDPMLVVSQPVVRSDFSGSPRGVVIMGRYLNKEEISRLAERTRPSLTFTRTDDPSLPAGLVSRIRSISGPAPGIIKQLNMDQVAGYALVHDIYGDDALVLQITETRDIYHQGLNTTMQVILIILAGGLFIGLLVIFLLDLVVLKRMSTLAVQVHAIGREGSTTDHVAIEGDDELSGLATEINRMLDTIETFHRKLGASEERFRELSDLLPQIIFELDTNATLTYVNEYGRELFGVSEKDLEKGVPARQFLIPEDLERINKNLKKVAAGEKSPGEIYTLVKKDKSLMRAIMFSSPVIHDGRLEGFRGSGIDISERIRLEEALSESEEKYRALTENSADIIFSLDVTGIFTYISPQVSRYGFSPDEVIGKAFHQFIHPVDRAKVLDDYRREMHDGISVISTFRIIDKPGAIHWIEENSNIKRDPQGNPTGMVGILRNVTDRVHAEEALRQSRERLENILRASPVIVFETDPAGNLLFASDLWEQLIGSPFETLKGRHWSEVLHPDDRVRLAQEVRTLIQERALVCAEARIIRPDGSVVWVLGQSVTVYNPDGSVHGHVGTITDITEHKRIEETLAENEEKYRALTENTGDVLYSMDMSGIFTYISPQVNKYGFLTEEIIGRSFRDIIHPEDLARVENNLSRDLEKGAQFHSTFRIFDKWGHVHWFDEKGTLRLDQSGKPLGIYGVLRDDSERKRAEEELTELKNIYMAIFDNTGSATIIVAYDTSIVMANPGWEKITGISRKESIGRRWTDFIHPEDLGMMKKHHFSRREGSSHVPREYTFRLIDASKNLHHCLVSVVMIPGTTNSIAAIVDITERKRAEEATELANKKLNLLNNITRHDILNTITGLLGCVDMADATASPEERTDLLNDIKELTRIIQRQITFTRDYQEVGVNLPQWQNVNEVINHTLQNFKNSDLYFFVDLENAEIYADPLLEKVFYNLVDNAIHYGESITIIKFSFLISDMGLFIICEDDGTGIPPEEKARIFERGVGRNTGMGLFLTREILGITGITIVETGVYGKGARFEIHIPRGTFRFVTAGNSLG